MRGPLKHPLIRFKKPLALAVALTLHILLCLALVPSQAAKLPSADVTGAGLSEVEGIALDLVELQDHMPEVPPSTMSLFLPMTGSEETVVAESDDGPSRPLSLAEALGGNPFQPASVQDRHMAEEAHARPDTHSSRSDSDLWKAIEPCWNRIADKDTMSVTLEVSFSPLGNLSKPPVIKRLPDANLNDRMLRSENQAITALSQCGPYLMAYGEEGVEVLFPGRGKL